MQELPNCNAEGCEKKARSLKGGYCQMHYTRLRNHGDVDVNLYAGRGESSWELPDGTIISEAKKIKNLKIILERIKNKRFLGYEKDGDDALDIIEKVLDDYHGTYKDGGVKRGKKTLTYAKYVADLTYSDWSFENDFLTFPQGKMISKIVSELSTSDTPIPFNDVCKNLGIESDDAEWLIKSFSKYPILGITYNLKEKTIEFSKDLGWFYELAPKNKLTLSGVPDEGFKAGLHEARRLSYKEYVQKQKL